MEEQFIDLFLRSVSLGINCSDDVTILFIEVVWGNIKFLFKIAGKEKYLHIYNSWNLNKGQMSFIIMLNQL